MDTGGSLRHLQEAVFKIKLKLINSKIHTTWFYLLEQVKCKVVPAHAVKSHGGVQA
jgi:hypothetical protein